MFNHEQPAKWAFISLGSNQGEREQQLQAAIAKLHQTPHISVIACSSLYETEPVGFVAQPFFLNMVALLQTQLSPHALLQQMLQVEQQMGRVREFRFGPRTIDLDLLLYEECAIETEELTVPHPRMHERAFVLVPLLELLEAAPFLEQQNLEQQYIHKMIAGLESKGGVELWKKVNWQKESGLFVN